MFCVDEWLLKNKISAKLIMQVHDELVLEVSESAVAVTRKEIRRLMTDAARLLVPLVVDIGTGKNWDEAH